MRDRGGCPSPWSCGSTAALRPLAAPGRGERDAISAILPRCGARRESPLDRPRVRVEPFEPRQPRDRRPEPAERPRSSLDEAGPLDEVVHPERRGEARRAAGREHVVGPGEVVAERLRRVRPDEDGARRGGCAAPSGAGHAPQLEVLRREPVRERDRLGEGRRHHHRAEARQRARGDGAPRQRGELLGERSRSRARRARGPASRRSTAASGSCSACASMSAATTSGSAVRSATISTSLGPAIESMSTWP